MADPMAEYHGSGLDWQRDPCPLPLAASSDLQGSTERPELSGLTHLDLESFIRRPPGYACHSAGAVRLRDLRVIPDDDASPDLRRLLFGGRRRRRHDGLPLPIDRATTLSDRNSRAVSTVHVILEDIVHYTLSSLHNIQKSLLYWKSRAEGTNVQRMYFMIFERGPRAFLETTWQTLTGLRSKSPSQYLLNSAAKIVYTRIDFLTSMQDCLAAFLAEVYSEADKCIGRLTENSDQSLRALLIGLNTVFLNLEQSLRNLVELQIFFERLPEVYVDSSTAATSIYENLLRLDSLISNKLAVHQKPRNKTIYWLPYTCGAIGLSACSLWLLRHSNFIGSSDTVGLIREAKESVAGYWDQHSGKLIIYIRDGLYETFKRTNKLISTKQDFHPIGEFLHRLGEELKHPPQKPPSRELPLAMPPKKIQEYAHDLQKKLLDLDRSVKEKQLGQQEAILELTKILEGNKIKFALCATWPAFGLCLLLFLLVQALVFHDQDEEEMSRLPQRMLLRDAELRLMEFQKCKTNGMEKRAGSKFGLMLCDLDRLYKTVEFHAKKTGEWSSVREDIVDLAKPHMRMADRLVVLSRLKEMYYCLLPSPSPSPSPSMCYPPSS